jgi:hypothetical protein
LIGHVAHLLVNGLSPSKDQGATWIIIFGLAGMTQAFMNEGHISRPSSSRVHQVPRVVISEPAPNTATPLSFTLKWNTNWLGWDGKKYNYNFANTFSEMTA